jgi:hypothetical protein
VITRSVKKEENTTTTTTTLLVDPLLVRAQAVVPPLRQIYDRYDTDGKMLPHFPRLIASRATWKSLKESRFTFLALNKP